MSDPLGDLGVNIERLRALLDKATPAPWSHGGQSRKSIGYYGPKGPDADLHRWRDVTLTQEFADGDLIAAMRNELPRLLDTLSELLRHASPPKALCPPHLSAAACEAALAAHEQDRAEVAP